MESQASSSSKYRLATFASIKVTNLIRDYCRIASRAETVTSSRRLALAINSTLNGNFATFMDYTIKTHKDQGCIIPRCLHKASRFAFEGMARWLFTMLTPHVRALEHLMGDSFEVAARLRQLSFQGQEKLIPLDLTDFYLSGKSHELACYVSSFFEDPDLRKLI